VLRNVETAHHNEHAEELNGVFHRVFEWSSDGALTKDSSQDDFLFVHQFFQRLYEAAKFLSRAVN
jgi:hypothetical protein